MARARCAVPVMACPDDLMQYIPMNAVRLRRLHQFGLSAAWRAWHWQAGDGADLVDQATRASRDGARRCGGVLALRWHCHWRLTAVGRPA